MIRPTLNRFITSGAPERQSDVLRLVGLHGFGVLTSLSIEQLGSVVHGAKHKVGKVNSETVRDE